MTRIVIEYLSGMPMIFVIFAEKYELPDVLANAENGMRAELDRYLRNGTPVYKQVEPVKRRYHDRD